LDQSESPKLQPHFFGADIPFLRHPRIAVAMILFLKKTESSKGFRLNAQAEKILEGIATNLLQAWEDSRNRSTRLFSVITSFVSGLQTISIGFSVPINAHPRIRSVI
jgi:hypothetical protein